jgi:hypothetical protein
MSIAYWCTFSYDRIFNRVLMRTDAGNRGSKHEASLFILKWLVCAKRTISWREMQAVKAIDIEKQAVDFERRRFRKTCKDLCGSLVEIHDDGVVELVHTTAKMYELPERGMTILKNNIFTDS